MSGAWKRADRKTTRQPKRRISRDLYVIGSNRHARIMCSPLYVTLPSHVSVDLHKEVTAALHGHFYKYPPVGARGDHWSVCISL
jgi:hypothetical protein